MIRRANITPVNIIRQGRRHYNNSYHSHHIPQCVLGALVLTNNHKQFSVALHYPEFKGISIERIDTHILRSGGANALSLAGYSDREIQKMGRWRSATFKEYIREELACFPSGMSTNMKRRFICVNITGGFYTDVTDQVIPLPYNSAIQVAG